MARRRMEAGRAYQRSPSSSVTYSPPVPPLFRSRTFPSRWEFSLFRALSSRGLRSRSAIRCTIVEYGTWCSPWLRAVSQQTSRSLEWGTQVPVCPGPSAFSFESVGVVPQVLRVVSLLVAP